MKRLITIIAAVAVLFAGCKKNDVDPTSGNKVTITNEKVINIDPTSVVVSGTYSFAVNLDDIYILVSTNGDMTDARAFESVLSGKDFTATVTELKENTKYYYKYKFVSADMEQESMETLSFKTMDIIVLEYVDLGLPSGILWATCNVDADYPEEYGSHYAWGETTTKSKYDWDTYKWCNGSYNTLTKYNTSGSYGTVDNKTVLEMTDDAARSHLGGTWRIPTYDELIELKTKCTWTWTTVEEVKGYLVTGHNGNSIFLPAAGFHEDDDPNFFDEFGHYWSSSLDANIPYNSYALFFHPGSISNGSYNRCCGGSIRPVCVR